MKFNEHLSHLMLLVLLLQQPCCCLLLLPVGQVENAGRFCLCLYLHTKKHFFHESYFKNIYIRKEGFSECLSEGFPHFQSCNLPSNFNVMRSLSTTL